MGHPLTVSLYLSDQYLYLGKIKSITCISKVKVIKSTFCNYKLDFPFYEKINFFIPNKNLTDLFFVFNEEEQYYKNENDKIDKDTEIKVIIEEIKYDLLKYNCITSLIIN